MVAAQLRWLRRVSRSTDPKHSAPSPAGSGSKRRTSIRDSHISAATSELSSSVVGNVDPGAIPVAARFLGSPIVEVIAMRPGELVFVEVYWLVSYVVKIRRVEDRVGLSCLVSAVRKTGLILPIPSPSMD